jgi:hypothetical protein
MLMSCIGEVEMKATTQELSFQGEILDRGFWLYVWEITTPKQELLYYVGRTGDSSSSNAQSPFNRMGQHLGFNAKNNVLRRSLKSKDVNPERCVFRLVAHGPILPEAANPEEHTKSRDLIAAMEKALALALVEAGYEVMNTVHCRTHLDAAAFGVVRAGFAAHFRNLARVSGKS